MEEAERAARGFGTRGAGPVAVVQVMLGWVIAIAIEDDSAFGIDYGFGYGDVVAHLIMYVLVAALVGYAQAWLFALPVVQLARLSARFTGWPAAVWAVPWGVALAVAYALPGFRPLLWPFEDTWFWIAVFGVLPVAAAGHAYRRNLSSRRMLGQTAGRAGIALLVLLVGAVLFAEARMPASPDPRPGLRIGPAEPQAAAAPPPGLQGPPEPQRSALVGTWADGKGARLLLHEGGQAAAEELPLERPAGEVARCSGGGTWTYRQGAVQVDVPGCEGDWAAPMVWAAGGTAGEPLLSRMVRDPAGWEKRELHKQ
ncbi:hypothetical protein ABZ924_17640 [Streptomyces sp. NPDC046876]|uniref:hypothetical protein n=1 Tax=Streptomyces sp. NPDC046876 TaxID=3155616 RepID=UPI0033DDF14F